MYLIEDVATRAIAIVIARLEKRCLLCEYINNFIKLKIFINTEVNISIIAGRYDYATHIFFIQHLEC